MTMLGFVAASPATVVIRSSGRKKIQVGSLFLVVVMVVVAVVGAYRMLQCSTLSVQYLYDA